MIYDARHVSGDYNAAALYKHLRSIIGNFPRIWKMARCVSFRQVDSTVLPWKSLAIHDGCGVVIVEHWSSSILSVE